MQKKHVARTVITIALFAALVAVFVISQQYDPTNPHSSVSKDEWINGEKGHGYAVMNNQSPWKQCYPCHEKKGLGGEEYCVNCHTKSGVNVNIPQPPK